MCIRDRLIRKSENKRRPTSVFASAPRFIATFVTRTWHLPSVCSECRLVDTSKLATPATSSVMCRRTTGALPGPMTIRIPFRTLVHGPQRRVGHDPMWADTMRLFILIACMRLHYIHVATQPPADTVFCSHRGVSPLQPSKEIVVGPHAHTHARAHMLARTALHARWVAVEWCA